jgi:hypothetical protein
VPFGKGNLQVTMKTKSWTTIGAVIGLTIGFIAGIIILTTMLEGSFVQWELLGHPESAISTLLTNNWGRVYVKTVNNETYEINLRNCQQKSGPCWEKVTAVSETPLSLADSSCSSRFSQMKRPPNLILQCVTYVSQIGGEYSDEINFALLSDGNIWVWELSSGGMSIDTYAPFAIGCIASPLVGTLTGLILVLCLSTWLRRRKHPIK